MCDVDVDVDDQIVGECVEVQNEAGEKPQFLRREMMRTKLIWRELVMLQMLLMLENCVKSGNPTQLVINWKGKYNFYTVNLN